MIDILEHIPRRYAIMKLLYGPKRVDLLIAAFAGLDECQPGSPATLRTGIAERAARMPKRPGTLRHESRHNGGAR